VLRLLLDLDSDGLMSDSEEKAMQAIGESASVNGILSVEACLSYALREGCANDKLLSNDCPEGSG
jgi:hypothetical protein